MNNEVFCEGHMDGFRHLDFALEGLENQFDVGVKIREEESDQFEVDPQTGAKVWYEPRLVLYASVVHADFPNDRKQLRYGLTRSAYETELKSVDEAVPILIKAALPALKSDLNLLRIGKQPASGNKLVMLRW